MINNKSKKSGDDQVKIAIIANTSWYLYNFRSNLIKSLIKGNYEVIAIAPKDEYSCNLKELGCSFVHIEIDSKSKNPLKDIKLLKDFLNIFYQSKPDILLNFTAKPNIYATLAARVINIPSINNIAGLGSGFVQESSTTKILRVLYRFSQKRAAKVFFQNPDDLDEFINKKMVLPERSSILPGSGVDLLRFEHKPLPDIKENKFVFLLISRVLYSKGIELLFTAAKRIFEAGNENFTVQILGQTGVNNADAIPVSKIDNWNNKPFFEYLGKTDDIRPHITNAHCVILPSYYREGTPKSILEGLAMGRPIITTDMPGCKTTVVEGVNGFLIFPKDVDDLERSMKKMLNLEITQLEEMGAKSRQLAENKFDEQIVIKEYLKNIEEVLIIDN